MRGALILHSASERVPVSKIEFVAARRRDQLALRFRLKGAISELAVPRTSTATRTDELWKHTCFEAFIRPGKAAGYFEFNFSPSTQWAAYRFDDYRNGMRTADDIVQPGGTVSVVHDDLALVAVLELGSVAEFRGRDWHVGLAAIVEARDGQKSYWALAHPPGKPDFHHADCFALELPQISGS